MREARQLVAAFFERLWNGRELDLAEEIIAPDCTTHQLQPDADPAGAPRGPAAIRHHIKAWLDAFPDLQMRVRQSVAEGDRVATHCTMTGTHEGVWMGMAATGKPVQLEMMVIHRVAGGRIAEDWVLVDSYGLFQQLGLVPPKPALLSGAQVFAQPS